jgi:TolB protein
LLSSRRNLIAVTAAAAVLVAGVIVYALGGHGSSPGAPPGVSAKAAAKPTAHMLRAGQTGGRAAIPWSLLGPGWTLAEVSTAQPNANGAATGGGRSMIYLVDPVGGKYRIQATTGSGALDLLAWSGDGKTALYDAGGGAGGAAAYGLLTLASGQLKPLQLPAGVTPIGFTRPDGLNILAVRQKGSKYRLERYSLAGTRQASLESLPRPASALDRLQGNALSSPDGTTAVWGVSGDEMQLVWNSGGLIRRLHVPGAGSPPSCTPISWWSSDTVLAYCNAAGTPGAGQLWLVPANGSQATPLTGPSGSTSGIGDLTGAWQAGGAMYITSTTAAQCTTAASGPGGQQVLLLSKSGAQTPVAIPGSTNHHATVVAGVGHRLLVLAQTSCPGTSSLIWVNTSTHTAQTVLTSPASEVGVVDAVPYGSGPAATTDGLN